MWRVNLGAGPPYFFSPQNTTDPYTRCQMLSLPGRSIVMTKVLTPGNPAIHLLRPAFAELPWRIARSTTICAGGMPCEAPTLCSTK